MSEIHKLNQKIEKAVVNGYQKIEEGIVEGYKKIENKFVKTLFCHEGESVEEARKRMEDKLK